jgi:hypothetical protein
MCDLIYLFLRFWLFFGKEIWECSVDLVFYFIFIFGQKINKQLLEVSLMKYRIILRVMPEI